MKNVVPFDAKLLSYDGKEYALEKGNNVIGRDNLNLKV